MTIEELFAVAVRAGEEEEDLSDLVDADTSDEDLDWIVVLLDAGLSHEAVRAAVRVGGGVN